MSPWIVALNALSFVSLGMPSALVLLACEERRRAGEQPPTAATVSLGRPCRGSGVVRCAESLPDGRSTAVAVAAPPEPIHQLGWNQLALPCPATRSSSGGRACGSRLAAIAARRSESSASSSCTLTWRDAAGALGSEQLRASASRTSRSSCSAEISSSLTRAAAAPPGCASARLRRSASCSAASSSRWSPHSSAQSTCGRPRTAAGVLPSCLVRRDSAASTRLDKPPGSDVSPAAEWSCELGPAA
mmetsp:Transcript_31475/g.78863  ORF Transcript_31475/g.78863 Transcript_31475/m.78863 type:complete len:245 (+) Transcript_31475:732-1466(+)